MAYARIEIRCRNVDNTQLLGIINDRIGNKTKGAPQSLFIIQIDSNVKESIIHGEPEDDNMFVDNIKTMRKMRILKSY